MGLRVWRQMNFLVVWRRSGITSGVVRLECSPFGAALPVVAGHLDGAVFGRLMMMAENPF